MDEKELYDILQLNVLSENNRDILHKAIVKFINEKEQKIRDEVKKELNEEYAIKFHHGQEHIIASAEKMIEETLAAFIKENSEKTKELVEEKERFTKAIREAKRQYKKKLHEYTDKLGTFVLTRVNEEVSELNEDRKEFTIQKVKYLKERKNLEKIYEQKLQRDIKKLVEFMEPVLKEEINEMHDNHKEYKLRCKELKETIRNEKINSNKKLNEQIESIKQMTAATLAKEKEKLAETINDYKRKKVESIDHYKELSENLQLEYKNKLNSLNSFVVEQITNEISEFEIDRQNLIETKVRLKEEAERKLKETQKLFIERAAKIIKEEIDTKVKNELTEMREDIEEARKNNFGKNLFETFEQEFRAYFYNENKEMKKLVESMNQLKQVNENTTKQIDSYKHLLEMANRKVKLTEDKAKREVLLNKLLAPLDNNKKETMAELLETVKTDNLETAFRRNLSTMLSEPISSPAQKRNRSGMESLLTESSNKPINVIEMTGDKSNKLSNAISTDNNRGLEDVRRLAGIKK